MSCDLEVFFLASPMTTSEYMKVPIKYFPLDIIAQYKVDGLVKNRYVYVEIMKGIYGLKQATVLADHQLATYIRTAAYQAIMESTSMWKYATKYTIFCLYVDDFGVKYFNKEDAKHLLDTLGQHYKYTVDWAGKTSVD